MVGDVWTTTAAPIASEMIEESRIGILLLNHLDALSFCYSRKR